MDWSGAQAPKLIVIREMWECGGLDWTGLD